MAPTSDERREVAERLRNRVNDSYSLFYTRLARRVFGDDAWGNKSENEIFDKLADLIDPTPNDSLARIADDLDAMRKELFGDERIEVDVNDNLKCFVHRLRMISGDAK